MPDFPKCRDLFMVCHTGNDRSWQDDVWICVGSDDIQVCALNLTCPTPDGIYHFSRSEWIFHDAPEMMLYTVFYRPGKVRNYNEGRCQEEYTTKAGESIW